MNIDAALRYFPVVKILESSKHKMEPVLEIGSGMNGITDYFSGKVHGVDSDYSKIKAVKNPNMIHKRGTILNIPFKNNSFFSVVCLDTLEHINKNSRLKAIEELIRVTRKGGIIYLGFPSGEMSRIFEQMINQLYERKHDSLNPWLSEHKKYGLPQKKEVTTYLNQLNVRKFSIKSNVNIFAWLLIHLLTTVLDRSVKAINLTRKIEYSLFSLVKRIELPPYYRLIFIIEK